jgi:tripartite-type tricarboxylate transporter receptor subunit TctC
VPKATPKDVIAALNATMVQILADPAVTARFDELGIQITPSAQQSPEALRTFQKAEARALVADHQGLRHQGGVNGFFPLLVLCF